MRRVLPTDSLPRYFEVPGEAMMALVADCLPSLPVIANSKFKALLKRRGADDRPLIGNAQEVVAAVGAALEDDYKGNVEEAPTAVWVFDYSIQRTSVKVLWRTIDGLGVYTRLKPPPGQSGGNILYGPAIYRLDEDRYCTWLG
jgi:hypothetical protein